MPQYLSPGVYVEEVAGGARPIEGGDTRTACFLGTLSGSTAATASPVLITSYGAFSTHFGQGINLAQEPFAASVRGFFENGGSRAYIVRLADNASTVTNIKERVRALQI